MLFLLNAPLSLKVYLLCLFSQNVFVANFVLFAFYSGVLLFRKIKDIPFLNIHFRWRMFLGSYFNFLLWSVVFIKWLCSDAWIFHFLLSITERAEFLCLLPGKVSLDEYLINLCELVDHLECYHGHQETCGRDDYMNNRDFWINVFVRFT